MAAALQRRLPTARSASLSAKLVWILTAIGLGGALGIALMLATVITPSFNRLEDASVTAHVERTRAVLGEFASKVESAVRDYGDWNDSYAYMADPSPAFERDSFSTLAMANLGMNGMAYLTPDRRVLIARWIDLERQGDLPIDRRRFVDALGRIDLDALLGQGSSTSFYLPLGDRLAAIGVARVRRSDGTGTPRGFVVMARAISSEQLSALLQIRAQLTIASGDGRAMVTSHREALDIAVPVVGAGGQAVANATFSVPRELSLLGRKMLMLAVGGTTLLLLLLLLMLRRMITRLVLRPLNRVERHMQQVRASGSMIPLEETPAEDEVGSLVVSFNAMLRQLNDLREQLEVQSFQLGRHESAVAVMHNVRNALNPISTVLSQMASAGVPVDRAVVARALGELAQEELVPARRQKLAAFVAAALSHEEEGALDRGRQLAIGHDALRHVLEIIGTQQAAAHERPPLETCDVTDLVARNAAIARYSGERSIAFVFPSKPHWVSANRVILSQVIGNLFSNAAEAIAAGAGEGGRIQVTIVERGDRVDVVIADTGEGFDPGTVPQLFQRGFSTRTHKSGGLGLHWCSNAMLGMGGALRLESDGRGCGARAVLTLQPGVDAIGLAA